MQILKDRESIRVKRKVQWRSLCRRVSTCGRPVQKRNRALEVMQHIGECNNIKAFVLDSIELVDFVAVKHKIEIIEIKHVACYDV